MSKLRLEEGETIAVTGANGQVARFVLGLAKWKGAKTIGIVRRNVQVQYADSTVISLVDDSICQKLNSIGTVQAIVDTVGIGTEHLIESLGHRGRIVILSSPTPNTAFPLHVKNFYRKDLTLHSAESMQYGAVESATLVRQVLPAIECGMLTPPELHEHIFSLDSVHDAYQLVSNGCAKRVVVAPNGNELLEVSTDKKNPCDER